MRAGEGCGLTALESSSPEGVTIRADKEMVFKIVIDP